MTSFVLNRRRERVDTLTPTERRNFHHLYWDVAWYGLLAGSSVAFLAVYAARIGASALQIGLLTAGPAAVSLLATLPVGRWLDHRAVGLTTFWAAVLFRAGYALWIFVPFLASSTQQIGALIWLVLLASVPGTLFAISFNALYAAAVPPAWRGHVTGIRQAVLAFAYIVSSLFCGLLLDTLSLETGYAIVFGLGLLGAIMSTIHLFFLRNVVADKEVGSLRTVITDYARPGSNRAFAMAPRLSVGLRSLVSHSKLLRVDVLRRGGYGGVMLGLFAFHFAQYLPAPLFALRWVNQLGFSDLVISQATAVFYAAVFIGSLQLDWLTRRYGHHRLTVAGALLLSSYPLFMALMTDVTLYMAGSILGGLAWAVVGGALANYLLDQAPDEDKASYLAWYNLALNAAILSASLLGPLLAALMGVVPALLASFVLRVLAGVIIWRAG